MLHDITLSDPSLVSGIAVPISVDKDDRVERFSSLDRNTCRTVNCDRIAKRLGPGEGMCAKHVGDDVLTPGIDLLKPSAPGSPTSDAATVFNVIARYVQLIFK